MWAAIGKFLGNSLKKLAIKAAAGDESSQRKLLTIILLPVVLFFVIIIVIIVLLYSPIMIAKEYVIDIKDNTPEFVQNFITSLGWCAEGDTSCQEYAEQAYYKELNETYKTYENRNTKIDVELITATITYKRYVQPDLYELNEDGQNQRFIDYYCDAHTSIFVADFGCKLYVKENYDKIYNENKEKYIKIANNYKELEERFCFQNNQTIETVLNIVTNTFPKRTILTGIESNTIQEACELSLWYLPEVANAVVNTDDNYLIYKHGKDEIDNLAKNMVNGTKLDYTKYEKYLIDEYIPNNLSDAYLYKDNKDKIIEQIANEIIGFSSLEEEKVTNLAFGNYFGSCKSVTIEDPKTGELSVHELEEYVAGVVQGELGTGAPEAQKLQAILARSFAVKNCDRVIKDSQDDQDYKTPTPKSTEAAAATNGLIAIYNGEILPEVSFASYPMEYYRDPNGFPGYYEQGYLCGAVDCSTGSDGRKWCKTTIYTQPGMEAYELYMPNNRLNGRTWNGNNLSNQTGHCYGVSQVALMYYEEELNYTYEQMINEFLSPGVEIVSINSFDINGTANTDGTSFLPKPLSAFLQENGSSVDLFNNTIRQSVLEAGPGTRSGVIAAATTLINGLSSYEVKLPYLSSVGGSPSGKYSGYGVDPEWGTNGKWWSAYYGRYYYQKGIDCSGFVTWSIHNGGFRYLRDTNSTGLKNTGYAYKFSEYTGQPADLLWHKGHIALIIGITESGYLIAEEAGGEDGLIVNTVPFNGGRGFTRIIDMSSFYANSSNLDLEYYRIGGTL